MQLYWSTQATSTIADTPPRSASSASRQSSALNSFLFISIRQLFLAAFQNSSPATPTSFSPKSNVSPRYTRPVCNSFVSPTYAKTRGYPHPKNVGAPTFSIFPLQFRIFRVRGRRQSKVAQALLPVQVCAMLIGCTARSGCAKRKGRAARLGRRALRWEGEETRRLAVLIHSGRKMREKKIPPGRASATFPR